MKLKVLQLDSSRVDRNGHIMSTDACVFYNTRVILVQSFSDSLKDVLGYADLTREGNTFLIENLTLPKVDDTILKLLTPAIGGKIVEREGNIIKSLTIDVISLNFHKNEDINIKSIGEQLHEQKTSN